MAFMDGLMFRVRLIVLVFFSLCIVACNNQSSASETIKIGDKTFVMPPETVGPWWSFQKDKQWLRLNLNAKTFMPQKTDTLEQKQTALTVLVGPLWSMDQGWYWTEKDKILKQNPISCEDYQYAGKRYKLCNHGANNERKTSPLRYTIVDDQKDVISFLRCDKSEVKLPNAQCDVRSRFMDNLQISYNYNIANFTDAIKIDQKLHKYISNFYRG